MGKIIRNGIEFSGACETATAVNYDNSLSGLNAQTVQEGLDELSDSLGKLSFKINDTLAWGTSKTFNIELYGLYMLFVTTTSDMAVYFVKNASESIVIIKPLISVNGITLTSANNKTLQLSSTISCSANLYQLN